MNFHFILIFYTDGDLISAAAHVCVNIYNFHYAFSQNSNLLQGF